MDRISKKVAILAKQNGYNERTNQAWSDKDDDLGDYTYHYFFNDDEKVKGHSRFPLYAAPTIDEFKKWFREVNRVDVEAYSSAGGYNWRLEKAYHNDWLSGGTFIKQSELNGPNDSGCWETYEEAMDEGFYQALLLIK
jgi:hypothetical protein